MCLDSSDPRTKAEQIADILRSEILRGVYRDTGRIPSRRELVDRFGVATQTVKNGLDILRAQKLISTSGNRGIFVCGLGSDADVFREMDEIRSEIAGLVRRLDELENRFRVEGM